MLTQTPLEAYLAIPMPSYEFIYPDDEETRRHLYSILDELVELSGAITFAFGNARIAPTISILDEAQHESLAKWKAFTENDLRQCEIVRVATPIPLENYDYMHNSEYNTEQNRVLTAVVGRLEFCKQLSDLLVYSNIARLGSIELRSSIVIQDGNRMEFTEIPPMDGFASQRAVAAASRMNWPSLTPLPLASVWSWAQRNNPLIDGFAHPPIARALSAFSRLFEKKSVDEPMQLLWALVGLEALYCRGKSELLQQVREKSQAFLGPQETYKKALSRMYDFRSRFIHGDLGFPSLSLLYEARDEVHRYDSELWEAVDIAVAVLAATLQEVVRRGWRDVSFTYLAHESVE